MNDDPSPSEAGFSEADHIRLLQLMTRRVIAERLGQRAQASERSDPAPGPPEEAGVTALIPDRWRLVPEGTSLYEWQKRCLPVWLEKKRGTVKVATGGGKTLFALAAAQALQNETEPDLRLVVVVPTIPLMFQWWDELRLGNLPASAIGLMGGGEALSSVSEVRVLICVLNSARERLPGIVRKAGWSKRMLLVVDECHRSGAARAKRIYECKPRYTLGLSATPEQDQDATEVPSDAAYEAGVVGKALGPIILDFSLRESLAAGLLTPFEVWHVGLPLSSAEADEHARLSREITELRKELQRRHRRARTTQAFLAWCQAQASRGGDAGGEAERFIGLANRRKRLLYRAEARREATLGILSGINEDADARAIVFHESIEEIEHVFLRAVEAGLPAVLEHSQLPDSLRAENINAFRRGVARIIVSAKSLVEGFNVPSADLGIIAASSSSVRQRIQSLGRMLRRKPSGRGARVVVLYVRDTEDEAIYEKADWENVIGAERNRYFAWRRTSGGEAWEGGLEELASPPRAYLPPSWDIDVSALSMGDVYPARAEGQDVKVDQDGNLRSEGGDLLSAPRKLVEKILELSAYRRARITPAGHLIARAGSGTGTGGGEWRFLGPVEMAVEHERSEVTRLRLRTVSGRRVIALEAHRLRGVIHFAKGPEKASHEAAGRARDVLLAWVRQEEARIGRPIKEICWDGGTAYWLEVDGETRPYPEPLPPLEFGQ